MNRLCRLLLSLLLLTAFGAAPRLTLLAQEEHGEDAEERHEKEDAEESEETETEENALETEGFSVTEHSVEIGGETLSYTATAGKLPIRRDGKETRGEIFFIAYTKNGVENAAKRPLTFSFNGGPGSSSVWLHLGVLGPRRVVLDEEGMQPSPPFQLVDNTYSILDQTDLVFIDPVSTGFSRAVGEEDPSSFHGVDEDIESVAEFIRLYLTRNERWGSPKFLAGESYGTTRAAGLSNYLLEQRGIYLNGIVLVSVVLEFQTIRFANGNELPYVLFLPSYTATAHLHGQLVQELQERPLEDVLREVEEFTVGDYQRALALDKLLPEDERESVIQRVAYYTGLDRDYIRRANMRVSMGRFGKELLREEGRSVGRFDSRYKGIDPDDVNDSYSYDPSYAALLGPYTSGVNQLLRGELDYKSDVPYEVLTGRVHPWNYGRFRAQYVNVAPNLRDAMTKNPYLQIYVASGYYDLATPYFATEYTFNRLNLDPSLQDNIQIHYYKAGHMMYVRMESLKKMKEDLDAFYEMATPDR